MLGTLLNCAGILLGAMAGVIARGEIPPRRQLLLKLLVGLALVWVGLSSALSALTSGRWHYFGFLFLVLLVSMVAGRIIGRLLHLQSALNRAGQFAKEKLSSPSANAGLLAASILFCAAPLGFVGAVEDGLGNRFHALLIKGVIDGLAAFSFARMFGMRIVLAAVPVALLLGGISFSASAALPWLETHRLLDPIRVVCGFLVVYVALIVFEVKKVELGDYLPAIAVAPAVAWLFR